MTGSPKDSDPRGPRPDVEPTVRSSERKRTTASNWPPREESPVAEVNTEPDHPLVPRVPGEPVPRLVSVSGDTNLSIELRPGINKVGRQRNDNHIVLVGPEISRFHAELIAEGPRVVLRDLGSANGTYVNDARVQGEQDLVPGDRVKFSEQFLFQLLVDCAETPDYMTLTPSRDDPLPNTDPPPPADGQVVPTSLRRRSQRLRTASAPHHDPVPEPAPTPAPARKASRVPPLRSEADQALMEQISQAVDLDALRDAPDQALAALERERRQLAVLYQVSKRCMSADGLPELDRLLINVLERIVSFDRGFISYQLPTGDWKLVMSPKGDRWERKVVRSMLQKALKTRQPLLVQDSRTNDSLGAPVPGRTDQRLLLPLVARSSPVGAVFLVSSYLDSFDEHTVDFLTLFADIAALSVVNCARLEASE